MKVSVVIPTYQRASMLAQTLPSVLAQHFDPAEYEVIVVVDGSSDGTVALLRSVQQTDNRLRIVKQSNQGAGAARNRGVAEARGEVILFVDDDAICEPDLVDVHWCKQRAARSRVVFGPVWVGEASSETLAARRLRAWTEAYTTRMEKHAPRFPDDIWICTNTSMRRETFLASGGFDVQLFPDVHEDAELAIRLWKNGVEFCYAPAAHATYIYNKTARNIVVTSSAYGARELSLCRQHPEYFAVSSLGRLDDGGGRRWVRAAVAMIPADVGRIAGWIMGIVESLSVRVIGKPHGEPLLRWLMWAAFLRGAAQAAGGWQALRAQCRVQS